MVLDGGPADAVLGAGGYLQCDDTPDAMVIEFYKLGLCKTKPTYEDYGDCEFLFDNSAGKTTTLSVGLSDSLVHEISISEGEYPYAMLVISNSLGLKNKVVFDNAIWSMDGGVGRYCVTNSNDHTFAPTDFSDGNYTCNTDSTVQPDVSFVTLKGFFLMMTTVSCRMHQFLRPRFWIKIRLQVRRLMLYCWIVKRMSHPLCQLLTNMAARFRQAKRHVCGSCKLSQSLS
ncbi:MAG: hypothetical protein EBU18_12410 [Rhodobacteraceae bacterium]|nr:hypothetical protein [Paracoccaceae bacterium]